MKKKTPKFVWYDSLKKQVEQAQAEKQYKISYTMKPEDVMTFVSGLHVVQLDMIDCAVVAKEREGFPEANAVIQHIRELKWNTRSACGAKKSGLSTRMN